MSLKCLLNCINEPSMHLISLGLQYPTVTICPPPTTAGKEYNSLSFIRAAYNQFAFVCSSEEECQKTRIIRKVFFLSLNCKFYPIYILHSQG